METVILFSGGSDSTLAAALELEKGRQVHLLTFNRSTFIGVHDYTQDNYRNLVRVYGENKIKREIISIDSLHRIVNYARYFQMFRKFGLATTCLCFSKIAMHWAACRYARENKISRVVDGSVPYMNLYPDQNKEIGYYNYQKFYQKFGIEYDTPVYEIADKVEQMLYDRGITRQPTVRQTEDDRQVYYLEQVLLALFVKFYQTCYNLETYEQVVGELYEERLEMVSGDLYGFV